VLIAKVLMRNGQNSLALEVPMVIPQAALMFGFTMIAAAVIVRFALGKEEALADRASSGSSA
jgi:hypothetical protein